MPEVISNSSCIILLRKTDRLSLLHQLYEVVSITSTVHSEINLELPIFIRITDPKSQGTVRSLEQILDPGEASTLALGLEKPEHLLIVDDFKARRIATNLGLKFTGTLGLVVKVRQRGLISSARGVVDELISAGIWISPEVKNSILKQAGE